MAVVMSCLSGCASLINGTRQKVNIASVPAGATVKVDDQEKGVTPLVVELARKSNHVIKIDLAGYLPYEATLTRKTSGWVWGNVLVGGIIGLAIDVGTGGMYCLAPEQVASQLSPQGPSHD
jgi:uncharacterized protein YceK